MLILPQTIKTKWNSKHKSYYESKGYIYTKMGNEFEVNVLDLPLTSQIKVSAICDYCGDKIVRAYCGANPNQKLSCRKCVSKRTKEQFGYSSTWELEKTKQSIKNTFIKKYGVDHNFKSKEVQEKRKQTFIKKYGVENPTSSESVKEKIRQTNLKKYGCVNPLNNRAISIKREKTMLKKYGVKFSVSENSEIAKQIRIKANKTLYKNGTGPSSKQQKYLCNLLNGKLNYPVDSILLDIAFPDEMIYVEYNGGGHDLQVKLGNITREEFNIKETKRYKYLKSKGWKLIRIESNYDKLILDNELIDLINYCKGYLSNHSWIEINIDSNKIICSEFEKNIEFKTYKI